MQKEFHHRWNITEIFISVFMLFILLLFTYGIFVAPYTGFRFHPSSGSIISVYVESDFTPTLQESDILIKVGSVLWEDYVENRTKSFFENAKPGQVIEIDVNRNNTQLTVPWKIPGFNAREFSLRFFNIWWLAYIFWFFGYVVQVFMRPREIIRRLLISANYLTALLLIFGSLSAWHLWGSSLLLRAVTWLAMPVYLHLHWIFPKSLRLMPKWFVLLVYMASLVLAIAELIQALPSGFYAFGFLFAIAGSAVLQGIHFVRWPDQRRQVGLLAIVIMLVAAPLISLAISGATSKISFLTFLVLPFIPLAYFYVIYRQQMGGLELRANRFISTYAFLILVGTILLLLVRPATILDISHEALAFLAVVVATLAIFISILVFPTFQALVDQRFLGIKLPYQNLQETYSSRITTSTSLDSLLQLLDDEVFPSLLIRQFALLQVSNESLKPLLVKNVPANALPVENRISDLVARSGKYIPNFSSANEWIRLILPLKVGDTFIGFWLLGRRDPDNLYPQAEILILQSIANQTAIALSNIHHSEQIRAMYQSDIERYEKERMRLALELHDSILNELAVLRTNLDETNLSPKFQTSYEELTHRLREIVSDLRPPMLMYGLKPAIVELADNLMERNGDKIKIHVDIQASEERVPENIEQHLYRIVQEGCENALRHAHAKRIGIFGTFTPQKIELMIEDDGTGFETQLEIDNLIANNHFGLAGMIERAHLINAKINFQSVPAAGLKIHITWAGNI